MLKKPTRSKQNKEIFKKTKRKKRKKRKLSGFWSSRGELEIGFIRPFPLYISGLKFFFFFNLFFEGEKNKKTYIYKFR